ncbi:MAG TPA: PQQ-binding-like beta-propeller repeat protein [Rhizomicrobium sp.]|nr:PQQ-binding-like beta-propeller repeat protein [Rhizomicrobium sp.]
MKADASVPPSGTLTAIDVNSGKIGWQYKSPRPMYGGVLATASDLVFAGEQTGDFSAFDARSGEKLWTHHFDTGVCSPPMTYRVAGVQYIAVGANGCRGGHIANGASPYGDAVAIFALAQR